MTISEVNILRNIWIFCLKETHGIFVTDVYLCRQGISIPEEFVIYRKKTGGGTNEKETEKERAAASD